MKTIITLIIFLTFSTGCSFKLSPVQNLPYTDTTTIKNLTGCYINLGEGKHGTEPVYLSQIIYPDYSFSHSQIEFIHVVSKKNNFLNTEALSNGETLFEKRFKKDKDFTLKDGTIKIKSEFLGHVLSPPGSPAIGVEYNTVTLGLDTAGDGKLRKSSSFAGTMFVFFPAAIKVTEHTRFIKTKNSSCHKS